MSIEAIDAARSVLLVIDMQNAFCHEEGTLGISGVDVAPARAIYGPVRRLAEAFGSAGLPVIWTRQVHLEADAGRAGKALVPHTAKRKRVSALSGTWDAAIVDELSDLAADPTFVVTKHRFGSFYETRLQALLSMLGTKALFVGGVTANACVETTLREAYLRDYDVVAVTDAIASVRPQWLGTAQEVWAQYLGVLATADEVCSWLTTSGQPQPTRLHHVLLEVSDLARSLEFYLDVLGFTVAKREAFRDGRDLVVTHQGLGLTTRPAATQGQGAAGGQGATGGALEHVCFGAKGVDALSERARSKGYKVVRGPGPGPYGHTVYVGDPDGNEVELVELR